MDRSKFRTCDQTSFCRRHRRRPPLSPYRAVLQDKNQIRNRSSGPSPNSNGNGNDHGHGNASSLVPSLSFQLIPDLQSVAENLVMKIYLMQSGVTRIRIVEDSSKSRVTYDREVLNLEEMVAADDVRILDLEEGSSYSYAWMLDHVTVTDADGRNNANDWLAYSYASDEFALLIRLEPQLEIYLFNVAQRDLLTAVNTQQMFYYEHHRVKSEERIAMEKNQETNNQNQQKNQKQDQNAGKKIVGYWEDGLAIYEDGTREEKRSVEDLFIGDDADGMWEENFSGHVDSKPYGPTSVGFDVVFPKSNHLYGLPEHASSTQLKTTIGPDAHYSEPYRLYNLDVFEYELDETMALYGAVPMIVSHTEDSTVGAFFFNPTETFVDISKYEYKGTEGTSAHWYAYSRVFFFPIKETN